MPQQDYLLSQREYVALYHRFWDDTLLGRVSTLNEKLRPQGEGNLKFKSFKSIRVKGGVWGSVTPSYLTPKNAISSEIMTSKRPI